MKDSHSNKHNNPSKNPLQSERENLKSMNQTGSTTMVHKPKEDDPSKKDNKNPEPNIAIYNQQLIMNNQMIDEDMKNSGMAINIPDNKLSSNIDTGNPYEELDKATSAKISQIFEAFEILESCQYANRFIVSISDDNNYEKMLFYCNDVSTFWSKYCFPASSRPFNMEIKSILNPLVAANMAFYCSSLPEFLSVTRQFSCSFCCCKRPAIVISSADTNKQIGKIMEPCNGCDPQYVCYDKDDNIKYIVKINCCQCSLICCKCSDAVCDVYKGNSMEKQEGNFIKYYSCMEVINNAGTWNVRFPSDATGDDKILLICACLFIDYKYFIESKSDEKFSLRKKTIRKRRGSKIYM